MSGMLGREADSYTAMTRPVRSHTFSWHVLIEAMTASTASPWPYTSLSALAESRKSRTSTPL
jgi:hypothetical protein